ncbi:MAG: hypothetical protein ACI9X4_001953 [Glaciecola sp.]|jgi:hypothetical protein
MRFRPHLRLKIQTRSLPRHRTRVNPASNLGLGSATTPSEFDKGLKPASLAMLASILWVDREWMPRLAAHASQIAAGEGPLEIEASAGAVQVEYLAA